ncbi:MAG: response regulator [Ignavibacteria bacterium]|nr:response regulator [Ignavibacteria bacterium]
MKKILYVEDNYDSQELMKIYLKDLAQTDCIDRAENILEVVDSKNYDLILMDINLPGKVDGVDAVRLLRKNNKFKNIPIVAVTAYAMVGDRERFLEAGCNDYIAKPFYRNQLIDLIKPYLED